MKRLAAVLLLIAAVTLPPLPCGAEALLPFAVRNQTPLVHAYGLSTPRDAAPLPSGQSRLRVISDIASHYAEDTRGDESIILDGESYRFSLAWDQALSGGWQVGMELPYIIYGGGFLDNFIEGWHDTFGLPQGGRDKAPTDDILYSYSRGGEELIRLDGSANGLGDLRLFALRQLLDDPQHSWAAVEFSLKLPTGDSDQLLGTGSVDAALSLSGLRRWALAGSDTSLYGSLGVMAGTDGDILEDQRRNVVAFATAGCGWQPHGWPAFKLQVDGNTPFYRDSALQELDSSAFFLTVGGAVPLGENSSLDIGVTEDIATNTASDVSFHFALNWRL